MAIVQGIREKVHLPLYDSLRVKPGEQLKDAESSSTFKFFVNVNGKTKLETNLQTASQLPSYNMFEARAMRVVVSDLPPEFPDAKDASIEDEDLDVTGEDERGATLRVGLTSRDGTGTVELNDGTANPILASFELGLDRAMELLAEAREDPDRVALLPLDDEGVTLYVGDYELSDAQYDRAAEIGDPIELSAADLIAYVQELDERKRPIREQLDRDGANLMSKIIYNTVTTLYVGEKVMIETPTFMFPGGAGAFSESGRAATHGEPNPTATFRFAEPIFIDRQQNFRVEISVPEGDVLKELQRVYGPLFIWVILDGYMTRTVQ